MQYLKQLSFSLLCITALIGTIQYPTQAQQSIRQISINQARGENGAQIPILEISPIYGLNISFIRTGETIRKVWLGDPSRIVIDFDSPLASIDSQDQARNPASAGGASIIRLRQLARPLALNLNLPEAARSSNETSLTIVTVSSSGRKLYQFRLALANRSRYSTIEVVPDTAMTVSRPGSVAAPRQSQVNTLSQPAPRKTDPRIRQLYRGVESAYQQGLLSLEEKQSIETALTLAEASSLEAATRDLGISLSLIDKLLKLGE